MDHCLITGRALRPGDLTHVLVDQTTQRRYAVLVSALPPPSSEPDPATPTATALPDSSLSPPATAAAPAAESGFAICRGDGQPPRCVVSARPARPPKRLLLRK